MRRAWVAVLVLSGACAKHITGPTPVVNAVTPSVACNDQAATVVAIGGKGLSPLNDGTLRTARLELPQIKLIPRQDLSGALVTGDPLSIPDSPDPQTASDVTWTSQEAMAFTLCPPGTCSKRTPPLAELPAIPNAGLYSIHVANRNGRSVTFPDSFAIVTPPVLTSESVGLLSVDVDNDVTLSGDNFYSLNGTPSSISVGTHVLTPTLSDCRALPSPSGTTLQSCRTARVSIPAGTLTAGTAQVVVGPGPVGCGSTNPLGITFVPAPQVHSVVSDVLCDAQGDRAITLNGSGFLVVNGVLPTVHIAAQSFAATSATGCSPVTGPAESVQSCTTLTLAIPQGTLDPASAGVTVTNPAPASGTSAPAVGLTVVPPPTVTSAATDLACNAEGTTFTLTGTGFITFGTSVPTVAISNGAQTVTMLPATPVASACTSIAGSAEAAASCTQVTVDVPAATLTAGMYAFTITNPDPVGCATAEAPTTLIVPPPSITQALPAPLCTAQGAVPYEIDGSGFLTVDASSPTVTLTPVTGTALTLQGTVISSSCSAVAGVSEAVQSCTRLTVELAQDSLVAGTSYALVVTNPTPAACASLEFASVMGVPPPEVTGVSSPTICRGGGEISVTGSGFIGGTSVNVGPLAATSVTVNEVGTGLTARLGAGLTVGTSYPLALNDNVGCSTTAAQQITVQDGPLLLSAEPSVVWNGITTRIAILGSHLTPPYVSLSLIPSSGGTPVTLTAEPDPLSQNRIQATVPAGTAAGTYDIVFTDSSCSAVLPGGLKVLGAAPVAGLTITPKTGYSGVDTPVQINSHANFQAVPRAYLTPSDGANGTATALAAVNYLDSSTLTAIVPKGVLPTGRYDLIVVNPDGSVGIASATSPDAPAPYTVVPNPAPIITTLNPGLVNYPTPETFEVVGKNFQAGAVLSLSCVDVSGVAFTPVFTQGSCDSGTDSTCIAGTVTSNLAGACVVSVANPDGGSFEFWSLVIENPAVKLGTFAATSSPMTEGRRALGLATGQANLSARFAYAFGGDDGFEANAKRSVEASTVDVFGHMGTWFALRNALSTPRTFVGSVSLGRFLYAIGGSNGTGAVASVERAAVLDPLQVPSIADVDLAEGNGQGLSGGVYVYRLAPVMDDADPFNPGGEGLASDPVIVQVPNLTDRVHLSLSWSAFAGVKPCPATPASTAAACGYRMYRSPAANATIGTEVLIADNVSGTSLLDDGLTPVLVDDHPVAPLPVGATGVWTAVSPLTTARSGAAITAIADTSNPAITHIYALGGNSGTEATPNVLSSTEYLAVTTAEDGSQTFGSWQPGPALSTARWLAGGFALDVGGTDALWVGPGETGSGTTSNVEACTLGAGGMPGSFSTSHGLGTRAGYATVSINGLLFAIGGGPGAPDSSIRQSQVETPAPELSNWSSSSATLVESRFLTAATIQSGFLFICGGQTDLVTATTGCESTIW